MIEKPIDKKDINELRELVILDTCLLSPEIGIRYNSIHQGLNKSDYPISNFVDFPFDIATRYYDNGKYARAYALTPYECGIAIFCEKKYNIYNILVLGEDDGAWFIPEYNTLEWINHKSTFISLISEALSIFNNNYKE